jgi:hypothetical protein
MGVWIKAIEPHFPTMEAQIPTTEYPVRAEERSFPPIEDLLDREEAQFMGNERRIRRKE